MKTALDSEKISRFKVISMREEKCASQCIPCTEKKKCIAVETFGI